MMVLLRTHSPIFALSVSVRRSTTRTHWRGPAHGNDHVLSIAMGNRYPILNFSDRHTHEVSKSDSACGFLFRTANLAFAVRWARPRFLLLKVL